MVRFSIIIILVILLGCTPKGPQTFNSNFIGKTKTELISSKGSAHKIKIFDNSEVYIYTKREEYFGKNASPDANALPKKIYEIEFIYYINNDNVVYKYQVWKKRVKN